MKYFVKNACLYEKHESMYDTRIFKGGAPFHCDRQAWNMELTLKVEIEKAREVSPLSSLYITSFSYVLPV